ncbi:MAG TPA: phosphotransferase [Mucilaginibacter sp.]
MIPEDKRNLVENALQTTFGTTEINDIHQLTAGLSTALVYRIAVQGKPYLLRIITRTDAMADPTLEYNCMQAAADAGIAPRVWYTSIADRIAITDFIDARPFPLEEAKIKLPELFKRLHALPPFPFRINYLDTMEGFIQKFQAAKLMPVHLMSEMLGAYTRIKAVYPRSDSDMVACHNDLKPENTLYDGERVWLVDWEAAFLNDRYLDLAIAANFAVRSEADETDYLKTYFGEDATAYRRARFFLMRQILHLFYFVVFVLMSKGAEGLIDFEKPVPLFRDFNDDIWAGKISLHDMDARLQYALVHRQQFLENIKLKRFEEALRVVSSSCGKE